MKEFEEKCLFVERSLQKMVLEACDWVYGIYYEVGEGDERVVIQIARCTGLEPEGDGKLAVSAKSITLDVTGDSTLTIAAKVIHALANEKF